MPQITIATCNEKPGLSPSDQILASALEARGATVMPAPWNGDFSPFAEADLTVVRSTWDYFDVPGDFQAWIDRLEKEANVLNPPAVLRWNMTKHYLFELLEKGAPVAPSVQVIRDPDAIAAAADALDVDELIVKPLSGAGASGLTRLKAGDKDGYDRAAAALNGDGLVQPFVPEIMTAGETSIIFFGGAFSHAIRKTPKAGDIRIQEEHGGTSAPVDIPAWAVDEAARILSMAPASTAYARIDVVLFEDRMTLMEAELVEPELFFTYCPDRADDLARVVWEAL